MDGQRFDALTRGLAVGASRRRLMRALAAGAAGALAGALGRRRVGAQGETCREPKQACFDDMECCGFAFLQTGAFCDKPRGRDRGKCTCAPGYAACGGTCVHLSEFEDDPSNCGACGNACSSDEVCFEGACTTLAPSDRDAKEGFATVDPAAVLAGVATLPISSWAYKSDDPTVRHIGPMAQDFAAVFGVGDNDRRIHVVDGQGVALAAIQGLHRELAALRAENAALAQRLATLEGSRAG